MPSDESVWFLTQNKDKFREARSILAPHKILIRQLNRPKLEIQDSKPENIAKFALETAVKRYRRLLVVEDSGLFVEVLSGFPGPFSSYVLETIGLGGVLDLLARSRKRTAYFQSSVAIGSPFLPTRVFTGRVRGKISRKILGRGGFGYDPIFIPDGSRRTFGQSSDAFKNRNSHRARAFLKFAGWYRKFSGRYDSRSKRALK